MLAQMPPVSRRSCLWTMLVRDVRLVEAAGGELRPVLPALYLFVEGDRHEVDELHRARRLEPRLDQLRLVGADDALGDGAL